MVANHLLLVTNVNCHVHHNQTMFSAHRGGHPTSHGRSCRCQWRTFQKWFYSPCQGIVGCWSCENSSNEKSPRYLSHSKRPMTFNVFLSEFQHVQSVWQCGPWKWPPLEWKGKPMTIIPSNIKRESIGICFISPQSERSELGAFYFFQGF